MTEDKTQNSTFMTKKLSFKVRLHMVTCSLKNINVISMKDFEIIIERYRARNTQVSAKACCFATIKSICFLRY